MHIKENIFAISFLTLLIISGIATPLLRNGNLGAQKESKTPPTPEKNVTPSTTSDTHESNEASDFKQMDKEVLQSQPQTNISKSQKVTTEAGSSSSYQEWWNADWEYRKNITIEEPGNVQRKAWPVNVFLEFSPKAHYRSLRVVNTSSGKEIPSQPWNLSRTGDYLSHATLTFLAEVAKGQNRTYQVYWSTDETAYPSYSRKLSTTQGDETYTIESLTSGYKIKTKKSAGAKVVNVTHLNGEKIQHEIAHFGITRDPATGYEQYWGDGDTNRESDAFYFAHEGDTFFSQYRGTIFTRYVVKNVPLVSEGTLLGEVNYTYTFYPSYWKVEEAIKWEASQVGTDYYTAGWVFDQDGGGRARYSHVADSDAITDIRDKGGGFIDPGLILETGTVTTSTNDSGWTKVSFNTQFDNPIVVATGQEGNDTERDPHGSDADRSRPIIRNVDSNGFEVRVLNDAQKLVKEKVGWIAVEKGHWTWYGVEIEAGEYTASYDSKTVTFQEAFPSSTVVVDMIQEETTWAETSRFDSMASEDYNVYWEDFDQDGQFTPGSARAGYIAIEKGVNSDLFESGIVPQSNADVENGEWSHVTFQNSYAETPLLFGNPLGTDGGNPAVLGRSSLNETGVNLRITEGLEDSEQWHTSTDIPWFVVSPRAEASVPETVDMTRNGTDWNKTAFFHVNGSDGIGVSYLSKEQAVTTFISENYTWYNEGNNRTDDYIYWARHVNLTTDVGDTCSNTYAVIPWSPTGTTSQERLSPFNRTYKATQHPVRVVVKQAERFRLNVSVQVKDKDERAMKGVEVHFRNASGSSLYSSVTDENGAATLIVNRSWYNLTLKFSSGGNTYQTYSTVAYNTTNYNYTVFHTSETLLFSSLVQLRIYATGKTQTTPIQYGEVRLTNESYQISSITNTTGWATFYLPCSKWDVRFNKTGGWDTFNLSYYSNETLVANATGDTTTAAGNDILPNVNITEYQEWKVVDIDVTEPPHPSELYLKERPTTLNPTWGKNVSGTMVLRNAENETKLRGNVSWYIFNADGEVVLTYKDAGVSPYTSDGVKEFSFNTSALKASRSYTLKINGAVNNTYYPFPGYQYPVPLALNLFIDPAPISTFSISYSPSRVISWNRSVTITVTYETSSPLTPGIRGATVNLTLYKGGYGDFYGLQPTGEPGEYQVAIDPFQHDGIGDYTFLFRAGAGNYSSIEKGEIFSVEPRSTTLETRASIRIPWQEQYTFTAEFKDTTPSQALDITGANVTFVLIGTSVKGVMNYVNGRYEAVLNITDVLPGTGEYTLKTFAGKKNFENVTVRTILEVKKRNTYLTPNTTSVKVSYTEQVAIKFHYEDLSYDNAPFGNPYISGATTTYLIPDLPDGGNKTGSLKDLGQGDYLFNISSTKLGVGVCRIYVNVGKSHYKAANERIPIEVKTIPTLISGPSKKSVVWGEHLTFQLTITNLLNGTGVQEASSNVTMEGESYTEYLTERANGTYMFNVTTRDLNVGTYIFVCTFAKEKYTIESFTTAVTIRSLAEHTEITYETMTTEVRKNPLTGSVPSEAKKVTISLYDKAHNRLLTGAKVKYRVEGIGSGYFTEQTPGTYVAFIDWSKAKVGESYRINSTVVGVTLAGQEIDLPSGMRVEAIADENVLVDYWGGSVKIGGFPLPNVWLYVIIGAVVALSSYGSFQLYKYLTTPPEVRELRELIANAQEGAFEYALITKEEMVEQKLEERIKT